MKDYTAEMIKDMAFAFCPQCGTAIVPNHKGRPRKFCSPECRSRWNNTHPKPENWKTVRSKICPVCGREFSYTVFDPDGKAVYPTTPAASVPHAVRVSINDLNIRKGPGTNYGKTGYYTGKGVFTIVAESAGTGSVKGWGKLKSGAGWISLGYAARI